MAGSGDGAAFEHPMSTEEFRRRAHELVDWIADYYEGIEARPVLSTAVPGSIIRTLPNECPEAPEEWDSIMSDINDVIMPGVTHWQSPSFFGYFPANSSAPGMLGEMLSAALNVIGFSWIGSPAATELEQVAMDMLASLIGLPDTFKCSSGTGGGVIQGTASEAALVAMLAARARILGPPPASSPEAPPETLRDITLGGSRELALVAYASDQAHSCVRKACMVAGVRHYRSVPTREEDGWAMTGAALKRAVEADMARGLTPAFVCCTLGTTGCGSVDRIAECAEVAQKYKIWLHVDAAYAGAAMVAPEMRWAMEGVEKADSFDMNPHKWMLVNFDCSALFVRDRAPLVQALTLTPAFLQNRATDSGAVIDYKDWQVPLGRRFRSIKLWAVMRSYGAEGLRAYIRSHIRMAADFHAWVVDSDLFEAAAPLSFSLVCFRLRGASDAANKDLLERVNASGKAFLTHTLLAGKFTLRMAVGGARTELRHVKQAWELLVEIGREVMSSAGGETEPSSD